MQENKMGTNDLVLIAAGLLPAIALCIYVYIKDRNEKEPIWFLLLLFSAGAFCCFPALLLERGIESALNSMFAGSMIVENGELYMQAGPYYAYHVLDNYFGVALVEEGLKWLALFLLTRNSRHFNSLFDGLIYAVFVSLGFAAYENVQYVLTYGLQTALVRSYSAVPGHMFNAVFMGYFYTLWHLYRFVRRAEGSLVKSGTIACRNMNAHFNSVSLGWLLALSLIVPVIIHGTYDFCLSIDSVLAYIFFYVMLITLYVLCFIRIHKLSKRDNSQDNLAVVMLTAAHPELASVFGILNGNSGNTVGRF